MKIKFYAIISTICVFSVAGCVSVEPVTSSSQSSTTESQKPETESDNEYEFGNSDHDVLYYQHTNTEVDLYKEDYSISSNLFLSNLTDGIDTSLLCQIPGCTHAEEDTDCPYNQYSYLGYWLPGIEKTIFFNYNGDNGYEEIYYVDQDSEIVSLLSFERQIHTPACAVEVDDTWYFFISEEDQTLDEDGNLETNFANGYFYSFDTISGELNLIFETGEYRSVNSTNTSLFYDDGKLFLQYEIKKKNLEEAGITQEEYEASLEEDNWMELWTKWFDMDCPILIYDIDEETTKLLEGFAYDDILIGAWAGKLIFAGGENFSDLYLYDIETRQSTPWLTKNDDIGRYAVIQWADFLCIKMYSSDSALTEYGICLRDDLTVHMLNIPYQKNLNFLSEDSSKLYIALDPISEDFDMDEEECKLIDKTEILSWIDDSYTFGDRVAKD